VPAIDESFLEEAPLDPMTALRYEIEGGGTFRLPPVSTIA